MKPTNKLKNLHPAIIAAIITTVMAVSLTLCICTLGPMMTAALLIGIFGTVVVWFSIWMLIERMM